MNCPACRQAVPSSGERCPSCGAVVAPMVEGALAPDPAHHARVEPLREIPGLRKRERTWKDEVRERVRDRRRQRAQQGDLPLFSDVEDEAPADDTSVEAAEPPDAGPPPGLAESRLGDPGHVPPAPTLELDEPPVTRAPGPEPPAEPDLPLRPAPPAFEASSLPLRGRAPLAEAEARPAEPRLELRRPTGEEDVEVAVPSSRWAMGTPPDEELAPVERPAFVFERFQAAVVDVVLLGALFATVVYFAARAAHVELPGLVPAWPYLAAFLAFLALNYAAYFTGATGQTLGKMLTGLRVVDAADDRPGYVRAMARAALGTLGTVLLVGVVPMFLDPARRGLHDRLLKTRVVKR